MYQSTKQVLNSSMAGIFGRRWDEAVGKFMDDGEMAGSARSATAKLGSEVAALKSAVAAGSGWGRPDLRQSPPPPQIWR
ncbi:unnamed protein product [Cuscuta epithymum]|uniref:Uncharacterized protein n=1 Tax=Cuscuta epithymum TaxID=186058 RepID=A0AAV0CJ49_9ASTE|nr:unnamed protein product [Cuscuta epithymum]